MKRDTCLMLAALLIATLVVSLPQFAFAAGSPWDDALTTLVGYLTGSTARLIAILAVAGLGIAAMAGRLSVQMALSVIIGIAIVFGAATIVGIFQIQ